MNSRQLLALIFFLAAPQKILWPHDFVQSIASYHLVPEAGLNVVAMLLPWLELLVAALLACEVWTGPALFLANGMLMTFLAALGSAYFRGIDVNCGCFSASGASGDMGWYLARDIVFLGIGLHAAWRYRRSNS